MINNDIQESLISFYYFFVITLKVATSRTICLVNLTILSPLEQVLESDQKMIQKIIENH